MTKIVLHNPQLLTMPFDTGMRATYKWLIELGLPQKKVPDPHLPCLSLRARSCRTWLSSGSSPCARCNRSGLIASRVSYRPVLVLCKNVTRLRADGACRAFTPKSTRIPCERQAAGPQYIPVGGSYDSPLKSRLSHSKGSLSTWIHTFGFG